MNKNNINNKSNMFNDNFIVDAIIQNEYLLERYDDVITKFKSNNSIIEKPTSDLDPYYTITINNEKIKLKATLIGKTSFVDDKSDLIYLKWSWSDTTLNKSSKVNLIKILKYFLDKEPDENSYVFSLVYNAFLQSIVKVDERFFSIIINTLLHLMKHLFYITITRVDGNNNINEIYLVKEIIN